MAISRAEALRKWLDQHPHNFSIVIGIRAALRLLPSVIEELRSRDREVAFDSFVALAAAAFRAAAFAVVKNKYPRDLELSYNDVRAVIHAAFLATSSTPLGVPNEKASIATNAIAFAARSDAVDRDQTLNGIEASISGAPSRKVVWQEVRADAEAIAEVGSSAKLFETPLWRGDKPRWFLNEWSELKQELVRGKWDVWIDWYEARLAGRATSEVYDFAFVPPDEVWEQGPAAANAWIAEHLPKTAPANEDLAQRPAAYSFRVVNGKFDVDPEDARSIDAETTRELYDEAKGNALDLKDRLARAQADEKVRAHVETLLKHLGDTFDDVRVGSLLKSLRRLESDLHAYSTEEARRELFPEALSLLANVVANVRDVLSTLPKWREIEAESVLLQMPFERLPEVEAQTHEAAESILASDAVTEAAKEAIADSVEAVADARGESERAKQTAYQLLDLANFVRSGIQHIRSTGAKIARPVVAGAKVAGRELGGLAGDSWKGVRRGLPKGIERGAQQVGKAMVVGGATALMGALAGPVAALGTLVGGFLPLGKGIESITEEQSVETTPKSEEPAVAPEPAAKASAKKAAKKPSGKAKK